MCSYFEVLPWLPTTDSEYAECRGVYYHDSVLSGNLYPHLLGASRYFREKFELVFLKIVNCDFD